MADISPKLSRIEPFDANIGTSIYFIFTGSQQALTNELKIIDMKTNLIVYQFEYSSFEKVHHIPPNILTNGSMYKATLRMKYTNGQYSSWSNEVKFRTFKTPVLDIDNIDGQGYVYNQDVTFVAKYEQENGEKVKNYQFSLYDENEDLIKLFPIRHPELNESEFTELVEKLEKGKGYFIQCKIETVNGFVYTHREKFVPMYIVPSVNGAIQTVNDSDDGFIRITSNLIQLLGTQAKADATDTYHSDNFEYEGGEWIVIKNGDYLQYSGLNMNRVSDFVMKVWFKNIPNNTMFLSLKPKDESGITIDFWKYKDRIVATKTNDKVTSSYRSNIMTISDNIDYMLYVKTIEHRIDLVVKNTVM